MLLTLLKTDTRLSSVCSIQPELVTSAQTPVPVNDERCCTKHLLPAKYADLPWTSTLAPHGSARCARLIVQPLQYTLACGQRAVKVLEIVFLSW